MNNIDPNQLQIIRKFISSRGFSSIDLQMEIVQKIAAEIEQVRAKNPNLGIEAAVKQVHAAYGVLGFSTIEDEMRQRLMKKYTKQYWQAFVANFRWPNILFSIILAVLFFFSFQNFGQSFLVFVVAAYVLMFVLGLAVFLYRKSVLNCTNF